MLKAFLQISCQLVDSNFASLEHEGRIYEIHASSNMWQVSICLNGAGRVPRSMLAILTQTVMARWGLSGVHFKYDPKTQTISISQKTPPLTSYDEFKNALERILSLAVEWESVLDSLDHHHGVKATQA